MLAIIISVLALFSIKSPLGNALDNGVARTPPMGWMSWQRFRCITDCVTYPDDCISDRLFRRTADLMVSEGYKDAGYEYIVIDDCWLSHTRDAQGRLQPDPDRFPHGMKNLSDYVHSKGLKFGIYENFGNFTCAKYPGIYGHLEVDANTFIDWDINYIKIDGCYAEIEDYAQGYTDFGRFLNKSSRPIVYSCSWPAYIEPKNISANYSYLSEICNLWRNWDDIQDSYASLTTILKWFSDNQDRIQPFAGPGHWNDPDMLLIGNYGLSYEQSKAQMALWAILAAPLLISTDLSTVDPEYKEILFNKDLIAINQDELGIQGKLVTTISKVSVWTRPITPLINNHHSYAVVFHSSRDDGYAYAVKCTLNELGLSNVLGYAIKYIFENEQPIKIVKSDEQLIVRVKPSGVVAFKATPLVIASSTV